MEKEETPFGNSSLDKEKAVKSEDVDDKKK
jgi:hypothetical protein